MTQRTAFITGASRGIGRACAGALAEAGARVILAARDTAKLEEAAAAIPGSSVVQIDLASPESIKEAFAKAGKIDILVNNAGITKDGLAMRMK
jgi:3-oxoacyl-[acyl-carrier protein] reductase